MSSHAAYRSDNDLLTRAAAGDGAAAFVLLERHGAHLQQQVAPLLGHQERAAAVVATFAALLAGTQRPPPGAGVAWLRATVVAYAGDAPIAPDAAAISASGAASPDELVAALADRLPHELRTALWCAWRDADAHDSPVVAPDADLTIRVAGGDPAAPVASYPLAPPPPAGLPALGLAAHDGLPTLHYHGAPRAATVVGRSLDRYIERPSPLRWVAPLALIAAFVALWAWWQLPGRESLDAPFPDPRLAVPTANWPTLPPRTTRVIALQNDPTPLPSALATVVSPATATRQPALVTALPSVAPSPTVVPPPVAAGGSAPPPTPIPVAPTPRPAATAAAPAPPAPPVPPTRPPLPTVTVPPQPTPTRPPANPPLLLVATQNLAFGVEAGPRTLSFTNAGGDPLHWRVVADSTWIELSQVAGTVPSGGTQTVAVAIARGDLPTGGYNGVLQLVTDGGEGLVPVVMAVSPSNTVVSAFTEPTTPIGALGCAEPTTYPVSAAIGGTRPPQKALLYFALNGGTQQTKELVAAAGRYRATLGPFTESGAVVYSLVITEADGTIVRSASYALQVLGCPTQVRTVPVVPPVTQPFALNGGGHTIYTFAVTQPGTLQVTLRWKGGAQRLSTLLYGPRRADQPYEQRTGVGSLTWAFPVTEADVTAGGTWALHLVNYEAGEANGTFDLTFTPLGQPLPTPAPSPTPTPIPIPARPAPSGTPGTPRPATPGTPRTP